MIYPTAVGHDIPTVWYTSPRRGMNVCPKGHGLKYGLSWGESNPTASQQIFCELFNLVLLALRQQGCVEPVKNLIKILSWEVLRSFHGDIFCQSKEESDGNTRRYFRGRWRCYDWKDPVKTYRGSTPLSLKPIIYLIEWRKPHRHTRSVYHLRRRYHTHRVYHPFCKERISFAPPER